MKNMVAIPLTAALVMLAVVLGNVFSSRAAEQSPEEQKAKISAKICELEAGPKCAETCGGSLKEAECEVDCKDVLASVCESTKNGTKSARTPRTKGIEVDICKLITMTVCEGSSGMCPDAQVSDCRKWCEDVVVDSCNLM
jgi:hypothetical protein